ncbi:MAG: YybS family protein [Quinella sp. 2Q5]|nr:YybS family protein [Quinella sp. 2Q5]
MVRNVTPTIEGGLLVAITVIMCLAAAYVPVLGILVEIFCAVPMAVLTARQGAGKGFTALIVATILLAILIGPLQAVLLMTGSGLCGYALGWCVRKNFSAVKIFLTVLIVSSVAQIFMFALWMLVMDISLETQLKMLHEFLDEGLTLAGQMGWLDQSQVPEAKAQVGAQLDSFVFLLPMLVLMSALLNAAVVWFTSKWIFPKLQMKLPSFPPFAEWKFPSVFLYMAAFGAIGMYWGFTRGWTELYGLSLNVTFAALLTGLVQGLSLVSFVMDRYSVSKVLRWILYLLIVFNAFLSQLVALTGLIDMLFDYRKKFLDGR